MTRSTRVRWAAAAGVVVLAAVGYVLFIPLQRPDESRLARLSEVRAPAGFSAKPSASAVLPLSDTPFTAAERAAKRTPDETGAYSEQWKGHGAEKGDESEVLVVLLPDAKDATTVAKEARQQYLGAKSLASAGYAISDHFEVAGVPGAKGATFAATSGTSTSRTTSAVARRGDVVAAFFAEAKGAAARHAVTTLVHEEYERLGTTEQGFSLAVTHFPLEASAIYGGATAVVAVLVLVVPPAVGGVRRRRRRARAESARRERMGRGRKVVRRQARHI